MSSILEIFKFSSILFILFLMIFYWKFTVIFFSISLIILTFFAYYLEHTKDLEF